MNLTDACLSPCIISSKLIAPSTLSADAEVCAFAGALATHANPIVVLSIPIPLAHFCELAVVAVVCARLEYAQIAGLLSCCNGIVCEIALF